MDENEDKTMEETNMSKTVSGVSMKAEDIRAIYERVQAQQSVKVGRITKSGQELMDYIDMIMSEMELEEVPVTTVAAFVAEATGKDVASVKGSLTSFLHSEGGSSRYVVGKDGRKNVIRKKEDE